MIPMRDGIKLHTIVYSPVNAISEEPILLQRTPYGAFNAPIVNDSAISVENFGSNYGPVYESWLFYRLPGYSWQIQK